MSSHPTANAILDHEFLPLRAKILEISAALDRVQRAFCDSISDARYGQLRSGIELLLDDQEGRAERVQLLFSRPYDHQWRDSLKLSR